ncbi:uncharacterized protein LOC120066975 [Benincasa hispida]|uniref:uncharacterized protein LOC120066975 n=1 Tax=Benincasa hispida TaxID=102211 RepID=UPI0019014A3E|nr:uncharacterized protein LOC120066975 [Benincasa hispida]
MYWAKLYQYPGVTIYLEKVGLQWWARVYQVHCTYDKMMTNIVECLNGVLKDACINIVTDYAMSILKELKLMSRTYRVSPVDMHIIHVDGGYLEGLVDLRSRTCTCMEFNCIEIPCSHAISAATLRNIKVQTLCAKWFTVECVLAAYAEPIFPVGHRQECS